MRRAKLKTRSMSCSISTTDTSAGSAATVARMSARSAAGTPAAGSAASSPPGPPHAARGLVEQQHLRPLRDRECDLEQAALAVRQLARGPVGVLLEPELVQ